MMKCPESIEDLDEIIKMVPLCKVTLFEQAKAKIESGAAKSVSEASRQIGEETGRNPESIRTRIREEATGRGVQLSEIAGTDKHRPKLELSPEEKQAVVNHAKVIAQEKREIQKEKNEALKASKPDPPTGKYRVIYADPPWKYGDGLTESYGPARFHYPSMTISELCDMPIKDIVEDDSVLFLWVTSPLLAECWPVIDAWGFKYKSSFIWDKIKHNYGHYNSVRHEFLLICTRGSCLPDVPELIDSVQSIERKEHSQKPIEFMEIIERLYPSGSRIELFIRGVARKGWAGWGNEAT